MRYTFSRQSYSISLTSLFTGKIRLVTLMLPDYFSYTTIVHGYQYTLFIFPESMMLPHFKTRNILVQDL